MFKQGSIYLANLNPQRGSEAGKVRPVFILQNQALLDIGHPSTLIIPLTTQLIDDAQPLRLRVFAAEKLTHDSDLLIDQIRAIDNRRLMNDQLLSCSTAFLIQVHSAVQEVIGANASFSFFLNK